MHLTKYMRSLYFITLMYTSGSWRLFHQQPVRNYAKGLRAPKLPGYPKQLGLDHVGVS